MMTKECAYPGCGRTLKAKSLCLGHYRQQRKGRNLSPLPPNTPEERFWSKVSKSTPDSCWEWVGSKSNGYGQVRIGGRLRFAHRVSWELANGPIPDGLVIDHRCVNPACVNPRHLRVVTVSQNGQHRTGSQKNSASGVRGVSWKKRRKVWLVQVQLNGRNHFGGHYFTIDEADAAARALRAKLHTHDDHDDWCTPPKETK